METVINEQLLQAQAELRKPDHVRKFKEKKYKEFSTNNVYTIKQKEKKNNGNARNRTNNGQINPLKVFYVVMYQYL